MKADVIRESRKVGFRHKDTRRWCKGIVGREHQSQPKDKFGLFGDIRWLVDACSVCGKESNWRSERVPGAWVSGDSSHPHWRRFAPSPSWVPDPPLLANNR